MKEGIEQKRKNELRDFVEEISRIKEEDIRTKRSAHLLEVDPVELTLDDAVVWEKVKAGTITENDLANYLGPFLDERGRFKSDFKGSRRRFMDMIRNKAAAIFLERELEEDK